jgi:hypothetical protein
MTVTETQQKVIDAQAELVEQTTTLAAETANLTPDQEALVAAQIVDMEALTERIRMFLQDLFR